MENEEKKEVVIVKVFSSYTPAQKKANQKYRENNIDKVKEMSRAYMNKRRQSDPEFRQKAREYQQQYYLKKKAEEIRKRYPENYDENGNRIVPLEEIKAKVKADKEKKKKDNKTNDMIAYRKEYYKNHIEEKKIQCPNCLLQVFKNALENHQKSKKCQIIASIRETYNDN